jgi:hypothetical protein
LRNGTSDFIEVDAAAAITLVGPGSGRRWPRPPPFRSEQENQRIGSTRYHVQLIIVFGWGSIVGLGAAASAVASRGRCGERSGRIRGARPPPKGRRSARKPVQLPPGVEPKSEAAGRWSVIAEPHLGGFPCDNSRFPEGWWP